MDKDSAKDTNAILATPQAGPDFKTVADEISAPADTLTANHIDGTPEKLHGDGLRLINEGKPEEAVPLLRRAAELKPTSAEIHHNLGVAYAHGNRLDEAVASFREALATQARRGVGIVEHGAGPGPAGQDRGGGGGVRGMPAA